MILFCAVCFGGADAAMRDSLNVGIFVLLGVTGFVLASFGWFFAAMARRARRVTLEDDRSAFPIGPAVPPGFPSP